MTGTASDLRVVDLRSGPCERWLEAGRPVVDRAVAIERIGRDLARASPWALRLLALESGSESGAGPVAGRLGGYVAPTGALRLWSVGYPEAIAAERRGAIARALVREAVAVARARDDVHFVESHPGYDSPHLPELRAALEHNGLRVVARAHVYSGRARTADPGANLPSGLAIERVDAVDDGALAVYERVRAATADRSDAQRLERPGSLRAELERQAPSRAAFVARLRGEVVGYLWASLDETRRESWILDVGVDPARRRGGVAHALLRRALAELAGADPWTVHALIDDENLPSLALHEGAGLWRSEGPFWTYRLVL